MSRGPRPPSTPRPPPTPEQVEALARRERVPARIARGDLEGKMRCRVWRKLHPEEARRFDQVYALMEQNPGLPLADAFGVLQSGMSVADFLARKERTQRKAVVKQARGEVDNNPVDTFVQGLIDSHTELALVLGERTVLDTLVGVEPIAFQLERAGRLEKLQVVLVIRWADWERLGSQLERDPRLAQKPAAVARQPDKRPFSDPRPFQGLVGRTVRLTLRNGIQLQLPLRMAGRFDLVLGEEGHEVFIPLHAIVRFDATSAPEPTQPAAPAA